MTKAEHIYAIKNKLNQGVASDDSRITNSLIAHYLKAARALLIKRKLDKYQSTSPQNFTTVCVKMEEDSYHDCSCLNLDLGCKVYKSTCKIPRDIMTRRGHTLTVKSLNGDIFSQISPTTNSLSKYSLSNKGKKPGWFIENERIVAVNLKAPYILASAVWENPDEVSNFCGCSANDDASLPCYDSNNDAFPIDSDLVLPMYEMTTNMLRDIYAYPQDTENDARTPQTNAPK